MISFQHTAMPNILSSKNCIINWNFPDLSTQISNICFFFLFYKINIDFNNLADIKFVIRMRQIKWQNVWKMPSVYAYISGQHERNIEKDHSVSVEDGRIREQRVVFTVVDRFCCWFVSRYVTLVVCCQRKRRHFNSFSTIIFLSGIDELKINFCIQKLQSIAMLF